MRLPPYLIPPLCAIISLTALSSPTLQLPNLTPNLSLINPTNLTTSTLNCIDLLNPFQPHAKQSHCALAIQHLPTYPEFGPFHTNGAPDPFQLPVTTSYRSCSVRVELNAGSHATVAASWPGIKVQAMALNGKCLGTVLPLFEGGWATFAKGGRILIVLGKSRDGS
ncbi:hypothetical protein BDR22DRAFT_848920, partial [Usnea florida]